MKIKKYLVLVLVMGLVFTSCKKDDDSTSSEPERDRTEQQVEDKEALLLYFDTHYYNSSDFETAGDYSIDDIVISELPTDADGNYMALPDPANNTMLSDIGVLETYTTTHLEVEYDYYILRLNTGGGDTPHFTDDVRLNYSGNLEDGDIFDSTVNPTKFDLISLISGWRNVIPKFKTSTSYVNNEDGTVTYSDYGVGVMFIPSGLAYFAIPPAGVTSYANLIFKFELYQTEVNDHDSDGVPSYMEDLDGNLDIYDDDTDGDLIPNFLDFDDDDDEVLTINEDLDEDGDPTNDDSDNDGIPNYLDADSTASNLDDE